jgi:hypothetical protein
MTNAAPLGRTRPTSRLRVWVLPGLLGVLFAASWHAGLWFVVVGMAAAALSVVVWERRDEAERAQRAAVWALEAPQGRCDLNALERSLCADLAAAATGNVRVLRTAAQRAHDGVSDPWRRALAVERLHRAGELAARSVVPTRRSLSTLLDRGAVIVVSGAIAGAALVAGSLTGSTLLLVPLTLAVATAAMALHARHRGRVMCSTLCLQAATPPPPGSAFAIPETAVTSGVDALVSSDRRILARAVAVVRSTSDPRREVALARLGDPSRLPAHVALRWHVVRWAAASVAALAPSLLI